MRRPRLLRRPRVSRSAIALVAALSFLPWPARAWGDEGHEVIAIMAASLLRPETLRRVRALLATDEDPLTEHDIASAATWADHLRDANADGARSRTRQWHFVDLELHHPSLAIACFGRVALPPGTLASQGPAQSCLVDKIGQFATELARPETPSDERLVALKFLLHLVGDIHQPLHAADDEDRGGNDKRVSATGMLAGTLHHFWDTEFVRKLGPDPREVAAALQRRLTPAEIARWSAGSAADWAFESSQLAVRDAYGRLPPPGPRGTYRLDDAYVDKAVQDCATQLSKAAVRLAFLLNGTIGRQ